MQHVRSSGDRSIGHLAMLDRPTYHLEAPGRFEFAVVAKRSNSERVVRWIGKDARKEGLADLSSRSRYENELLALHLLYFNRLHSIFQPGRGMALASGGLSRDIGGGPVDDAPARRARAACTMWTT
jgi:hypothetical protein